MKISTRTLLLLLALLIAPAHAKATQDVENPQDIIAYIRLVMSEPEIAAKLLKLIKNGCTWENEVFWSGSPSEEQLKTRIFWMNFSLQLATQNGAKFWKTFAFSNKNGGPILEIIDTTKSEQVLDCND